MLTVYCASLGLFVGSVRAADLWPFVPLQTGPSQILEEALLGVCYCSFLVCVFDP